MKKVVLGGVGGLVALAGLFTLAGRGLGELGGYFRAGAEGTVAQIEEQIPDEVHDRKLAHDLTVVRKEVIDRQVQLSQSKTQIAQLRDDVAKLETSATTRQRLLSEAYPILERAERETLATVRFAGTDYPLADFQRHLDDLMAAQEAESKQLEIKKSGLARLEKSEKEAELALADMRRALESAEHEVAVLQSRREQADVESQTLDMVTSVSGGVHATTDGVGRSLDRLRTDVARKEAVNDAKRGLAPVSTRSSTNALARQWNRLESLKKYRDQPTGQDAANAKLPAPTTQASTEAAAEAATDAATDADTPPSTP
jgi:DNA repair exonuclease SbcCD ATPase subunit